MHSVFSAVRDLKKQCLHLIRIQDDSQRSDLLMMECRVFILQWAGYKLNRCDISVEALKKSKYPFQVLKCQ